MLRIVAWDAAAPLAVINSVTVAFYSPAWPIAIAAAFFRQWLLALLSLLVVLAQIAFLAPEFTATQPLPKWTSKASTFELLDANVYDENPSMSGYEAQIREFRPQVVAFRRGHDSRRRSN